VKTSAEGPGGGVVFFEVPDGSVRVAVRLEGDSVWLSLTQMAELFGRDKSVISRHLRNVFASGELERAATVARNATVQREGDREVVRAIEFFNLDAILSVGYRVNSKRGTQFRIWATATLRDHLLRGYTLNERRLRDRGLGEVEEAVGLLARTLTSHALVTDEGRAVLDVVQQYMRAWRLLLEYDEDRLAPVPRSPVAPTAALSPEEARAAVCACAKPSSPEARPGRCSARSRATYLPGSSAQSSRPSVARRCTRARRPAPRIYCTSSSRTTRFPTATSASRRAMRRTRNLRSDWC
jgi:Virulence protein RhuM family